MASRIFVNLPVKDLQKSIGVAYTTYKKEVPMLIPFSKKLTGPSRKKSLV